MNTGEAVINAMLEPLRQYYERADTEEIAVVKPGLVFRRGRQADALGRIWIPHRDERLSYEYLLDLAFVVAAMYGKGFDGEERAALWATLPGKHRIMAVAGSAVFYDEPSSRDGIAMNIRQATRGDTANRDLSSWGLDPTRPVHETKGETILRRVRRRIPGAYEAVMAAAASGEPMIFSGQPGAGKTTLMNTLLKEVDENKRIVTVEDTPEFEVHNPNRMHIHMERGEDGKRSGITPKDVVDVVVRATPDGLLVGEISTTNAAMALELMGTGNQHYMTTIHAGDSEEAFDTFATRVQHIKPEENKDRVIASLKKRCWVIQIVREGTRRRVSEVRPPDSYEGEIEETKT